MGNKKVRVRIAPSPTGDPHVGTAYTALFNYAFAKSQGGDFILRIEDTDRARSLREYEDRIFEALHWIGLKWDEGPDCGGPRGPYRQSERSEIYRKHSELLIENGHAYRCFCTPERLKDLRKTQQKEKKRTKYDSKCAALWESEVKTFCERGMPFTVRMKVPDQGLCTVNDLLRGVVRIDYETIDDQVLLKSDGFPTYHLANVVDDHLMGITHVIRGEEWLPSAPKHLLLYSYFGWEPPVLCHLPLLRNPDHSKLSKRKNPTSMNYYRRLGVLPEALLNFLGLMGWTMPDEQEMFSLEEMVEKFDIKRMSLGGPVFDLLKLRALNARYIREKMDPDALFERLEGWLINKDYLKKTIPLAQKRLTVLSDYIPMVSFLLSGQIDYPQEDLVMKGRSGEELKEIIQIAIWEIEKIRNFTGEELYSCFVHMADKFGISHRDFFLPFFVAISGKRVSLPLFESMEIIGRDLCRMRLVEALNRFKEPGLTGKALKRAEKRYKEMLQREDG